LKRSISFFRKDNNNDIKDELLLYSVRSNEEVQKIENKE